MSSNNFLVEMLNSHFQDQPVKIKSLSAEQIGIYSTLMLYAEEDVTAPVPEEKNTDSLLEKQNINPEKLSINDCKDKLMRHYRECFIQFESQYHQHRNELTRQYNNEAIHILEDKKQLIKFYRKQMDQLLLFYHESVNELTTNHNNRIKSLIDTHKTNETQLYNGFRVEINEILLEQREDIASIARQRANQLQEELEELILQEDKIYSSRTETLMSELSNELKQEEQKYLRELEKTEAANQEVIAKKDRLEEKLKKKLISDLDKLKTTYERDFQKLENFTTQQKEKTVALGQKRASYLAQIYQEISIDKPTQEQPVIIESESLLIINNTVVCEYLRANKPNPENIAKAFEIFLTDFITKNKLLPKGVSLTCQNLNDNLLIRLKSVHSETKDDDIISFNMSSIDTYKINQLKAKLTTLEEQQQFDSSANLTQYIAALKSELKQFRCMNLLSVILILFKCIDKDNTERCLLSRHGSKLSLSANLVFKMLTMPPNQFFTVLAPLLQLSAQGDLLQTDLRYDRDQDKIIIALRHAKNNDILNFNNIKPFLIKIKHFYDVKFYENHQHITLTPPQHSLELLNFIYLWLKQEELCHQARVSLDWLTTNEHTMIFDEDRGLYIRACLEKCLRQYQLEDLLPKNVQLNWRHEGNRLILQMTGEHLDQAINSNPKSTNEIDDLDSTISKLQINNIDKRHQNSIKALEQERANLVKNHLSHIDSNARINKKLSFSELEKRGQHLQKRKKSKTIPLKQSKELEGLTAKQTQTQVMLILKILSATLRQNSSDKIGLFLAQFKIELPIDATFVAITVSPQAYPEVIKKLFDLDHFSEEFNTEFTRTVSLNLSPEDTFQFLTKHVYLFWQQKELKDKAPFTPNIDFFEDATPTASHRVPKNTKRRRIFSI